MCPLAGPELPHGLGSNGRMVFSTAFARPATGAACGDGMPHHSDDCDHFAFRAFIRHTEDRFRLALDGLMVQHGLRVDPEVA